jgi:DNA-binding IclR family transcriptional regulator
MVTTSGSVPALERGLAVLEQLGQPRADGATVAELQWALKIPTMSLYRIIRVLEERAYIRQDSDGRYRLGPRQIELGFVARSISPLVQAALPILRDVAGQTHEMAELSVRAGRWDLMMLETWIAERTPVRIRSRAGLLFELAPNTPHGLCYLVFDGPRLVEEFLAQRVHQDILRRMEHRDLLEARERCRTLGFAWHKKTGPGDIARVAAPVFDPHSSPSRLAATIGIALEESRLTTLRATAWGNLLKRAARQLEEKL